MSSTTPTRHRARIRQDHRVLVERIHGLQAALQRQQSDGDVTRLKGELLAELDRRQEMEREIMTMNAYPLTFTHVEAHVSMRDQFQTILNSINSETINNDNVGKLLLKVHDYHVKYFDEILSYYLTDKYSLAAVDDGLGI